MPPPGSLPARRHATVDAPRWEYLDALGTDLTYLEKIMREREERKETARRHRDEVRHLVDWLLENEP